MRFLNFTCPKLNYLSSLYPSLAPLADLPIPVDGNSILPLAWDQNLRVILRALLLSYLKSLSANTVPLLPTPLLPPSSKPPSSVPWVIQQPLTVLSASQSDPF